MSAPECREPDSSKITNLGNGDATQIPCPAMESREPTPEKPPLYFPQPGDELPVKQEETMGPIGPAATGRVDFSPMKGLTGVRPVGDRHSITQSGESQWRAHNLTFFKQSNENIQKAQLAISNAKRCMKQSYKEVDKTQWESTDHLRARAKTVHQWKTELEHGINDITEEIELLEGERRRVKQSLSVLTIPESIAGEFIQLRSKRLGNDLVRDDVEENLVKELAICSEIRDLLGRTRGQIEIQLTELKAVKTKLETDWTDKRQAYDIDSDCVKLKNVSPTILWRPGATRFPADQSSSSTYEHYTRESLMTAETARQRSITLRSTLGAIYTDTMKDLRDQATRVNIALDKKIKLVEAICQKLENELLRCLYELANTEKAIEQMRHSTRGLDNAMKVAQTRLASRLLRSNVENCRDTSQFALVDEVKTLNERTSAILGVLKQTEETQAGLVKARSDLEREIIAKRKTLYVDRKRGQTLRSFYPSLATLSGF